MKKILIADDHSMVRAGLKLCLSSILPDPEFREASNGPEVISLLKQYSFDLFILDIHMPGTDALDIMQYVNNIYPGTKVLIFSMSPEMMYARRFLQEGAKGYLTKDAPVRELKKAINEILSGGIYTSNALRQIFVQDSVNNRSSNPFNRLTKREFEITSRLLSGQGLSQISKSLHLHSSTVGTHKARVFEKLEIGNILELKELAIVHEV